MSLFELFEKDELTIEILFECIGERDEDFAEVLQQKYEDESYLKGKIFSENQYDILWTLDYRKCENAGCDDYYMDNYMNNYKDIKPCPSCKYGIPATNLKDVINTVLYCDNSNANANANAGCTDCPICFNEFDSKKFTGKLICSHEFHVHCIQQWLDTKTTCPCCRTVVLEKEDASYSSDTSEQEGSEQEESIEYENEVASEQEQDAIDASDVNEQDANEQDVNEGRDYEMIRREHRRNYLNNILSRIRCRERAQEFYCILQEYIRAESAEELCDELYSQLIQYDDPNRL